MVRKMFPDKCIILKNKERMRKIFLIFFVGVLGIWVSRQTQEVPMMNDVLLENVEALADIENKLPVYCRGIGTVVCPEIGQGVKLVYEGYSLDPDEETY